MIKLIIGLRGSGKTKTLVNMVNSAADASNGDVICIEFGNKLNYDIKPQARLVDSTAYSINNATALYGFIAGILASNYDITHIYVDSVLKICNYDMAEFLTRSRNSFNTNPYLTHKMLSRQCYRVVSIILCKEIHHGRQQK